MMKFELTKDNLSELNTLIYNKDSKSVLSFIEDCHPADIAEILDQLDFESLL
jgi:hypothetical protein